MTIFAYLCAVEYTFAIVCSNNSKLSVVAEVCSGDKDSAASLVPQGNLLVRDVPQSQFPIQGPTQEIAVILCNKERASWGFKASQHIDRPDNSNEWLNVKKISQKMLPVLILIYISDEQNRTKLYYDDEVNRV